MNLKQQQEQSYLKNKLLNIHNDYSDEPPPLQEQTLSQGELEKFIKLQQAQKEKSQQIQNQNSFRGVSFSNENKQNIKQKGSVTIENLNNSQNNQNNSYMFRQPNQQQSHNIQQKMFGGSMNLNDINYSPKENNNNKQFNGQLIINKGETLADSISLSNQNSNYQNLFQKQNNSQSQSDYQPQQQEEDFRDQAEKLIDEYLKKINPPKPLKEIENLSNALIEKDLQNLQLDEQASNKKIQDLHEKINATTIQNDPRIQFWKEQINSENQKINLNNKISNLYNDKIVLRNYIENQNEIIEKMSQSIINVYVKFSSDINKLKNYNNILPSEKEVLLQKQFEEIQQKYEQEVSERKQIENDLQLNILDFQSLYVDAQEAKSIIMEQLKEIKIKKEELEFMKIQFEQEKTKLGGGGAHLQNMHINQNHNLQTQLEEAKEQQSLNQQNIYQDSSNVNKSDLDLQKDLLKNTSNNSQTNKIQIKILEDKNNNNQPEKTLQTKDFFNLENQESAFKQNLQNIRSSLLSSVLSKKFLEENDDQDHQNFEFSKNQTVHNNQQKVKDQQLFQQSNFQSYSQQQNLQKQNNISHNNNVFQQNLLQVPLQSQLRPNNQVLNQDFSNNNNNYHNHTDNPQKQKLQVNDSSFHLNNSFNNDNISFNENILLNDIYEAPKIPKLYANFQMHLQNVNFNTNNNENQQYSSNNSSVNMQQSATQQAQQHHQMLQFQEQLEKKLNQSHKQDFKQSGLKSVNNMSQQVSIKEKSETKNQNSQQLQQQSHQQNVDKIKGMIKSLRQDHQNLIKEHFE